MNADQFSFQQTASGIRGERELGVDTMKAIVSNYRGEREKQIGFLNSETNKFFFNDTSFVDAYGNPAPVVSDKLLYARVLDKIRTAKNNITSKARNIEYTEREIEKYEVEIYKKYAIPAACIVFILIGAPLGVMVKKGGFGVAASISLFFFLIYWAFLIGGEKLAERGFFSPFIGMWAANFLLGFLGIILTIKTNRETVTIKFTFFKRLVPKRFRLQQAADEAY